MLFYENIYVAVDGSKEAEYAFKKAIAISKRNEGAKIHLYHIIDDRSTTTIVDAFDRTYITEATKYAEELLQEYKAKATAAGVPDVETYIGKGSPKNLLLKVFSKLKDTDLVICGATGLNRVERMFIGSVSDNIVRSSGCDVLVVRTPDPKEI